MVEKQYNAIVKHYEKCYKENGDNNLGVDWPKKEDVDKRYKVMLEIAEFDKGNNDIRTPHILDFGCGLAHMYKYMIDNNIPYIYSGLDISNIFINKCKEKYPNLEFVCCDILENPQEIEKKYDYIIMNGVFTEKRELSFNEMFDYFKKMISKIFSLCNKGIAFNVMSKDVDWEREDLFHLPLNTLSDYLTKEVSRNYIIRNDYGLYEYTVYIYK